MLKQFEKLDDVDESCNSPIKPIDDPDEIQLLEDLNALSAIKKTSEESSNSDKDEVVFKFESRLNSVGSAAHRNLIIRPNRIYQNNM